MPPNTCSRPTIGSRPQSDTGHQAQLSSSSVSTESSDQPTAATAGILAVSGCLPRALDSGEPLPPRARAALVELRFPLVVVRFFLLSSLALLTYQLLRTQPAPFFLQSEFAVNGINFRRSLPVLKARIRDGIP